MEFVLCSWCARSGASDAARRRWRDCGPASTHREPVTTLSNTPAPGPADRTGSTDDSAGTPVERALVAARNRAASRQLNVAAAKAGLVPAGPGPTANPPASGRRQMLKCRTCGRTEPRPGDDLGRLARGSWPECCGKVMPPAPDPDAEPAPAE